MQKNIITRIGETIDSFYAEKQTEIPAGQRPTRSNFSRILQWLLPNGGTIIIVLALFLTQTVWARSYQGILNPSNSTGTIAYQGRLADSSGVPLTSTYPMVFRLYNTASGGAPLWEEQWTASNSVAVSDGLFNVMLGSITPVPQNILSSNSSLWLGISVGTDSEMTPRVQLGSVPYAFQALTVPDGAITNAKLADGSVSQAKLGADVSLVPPDGSISTSKLADSAVIPEKIKLDSGSTCLSSYTTLNTPGIWQGIKIPGLTLSFSVNKTSSVLVWINVNYYITVSTNYAHAIYVDNISQSGLTDYPLNLGYHPLNFMKQITVPSGSHTIEIEASAGAIAPIEYNSGTCINYIVLANGQ